MRGVGSRPMASPASRPLPLSSQAARMGSRVWGWVFRLDHALGEIGLHDPPHTQPGPWAKRAGLAWEPGQLQRAPCLVSGGPRSRPAPPFPFGTARVGRWGSLCSPRPGTGCPRGLCWDPWPTLGSSETAPMSPVLGDSGGMYVEQGSSGGLAFLPVPPKLVLCGDCIPVSLKVGRQTSKWVLAAGARPGHTAGGAEPDGGLVP